METLNYKNNEGDDKRITFIKAIGEGTFGIVYEALLDGYGTVAVKKQKLSNITIKELNIETQLIPLLPVYSILLKKIIVNPKYKINPDISSNPNVSFSEDAIENKVYIIYELIDGFALDKIININKEQHISFSIPIFKRYVNDLLQGLLEMKTAGVAHRDIKPANIMLSRGTLKYIDFGMSCFFDNCSGKKGSPNYLPPEHYKDDKIINWHKMDVFAIGTIIFAMITGSAIWKSLGFKNSIEIKNFCISNTYEKIGKSFAICILKAFEPFEDFKDFMPIVIAMTQTDPTNRPNVEECIQFFSNIE